MATQELTFANELPLVNYGKDVEREIAVLEAAIRVNADLTGQYNPRWLAIKLLENDEDILEQVKKHSDAAVLFEKVEACTARLRKVYDDEVDIIIADRRYGWIHGLVQETVVRSTQNRMTFSDRIDRIVTDRVLGIPIFLLMMWFVFKFTTDVAAPFLDWIDGLIAGPITKWVVDLLALVGLSGSWVESLMVDGMIAGVGGVLVFVPVLMSLYMALAVLEDSGYMARAAFVMDRLMHVLGLHGKSFLPMIVGFGCTVPAFYATRTLENERDRILTGLLVPFMSCGARLPVYVLFAAIFFPENAGTVIFSMYLLGIVVAILLGLILKNTLFKTNHQGSFVMEMPPYRIPTLKGVWINTWERTSSFVRKAWTLILGTSVVIWVLLAIPVNSSNQFAQINVGDSAFAAVSRMIAPIFTPAGFGNWESSGSIITGFVAKEVVVSTMSQVYEVEETAEEEVEPTTFLEDVGGILTSFVGATVDTVKSIPLLVGINLFEEEEEEPMTGLMLAIEEGFRQSSGAHGKLAGLAFMIFTLLYTPCMVAVAAERAEFGAKWMWVSIIGQFVLAWLAAVIVFQGGKLLGLG
ncbi:iron transporter [Ornatilinea apprima]|uniref:Ferrous iron transport protein B n=1 Tax=Ornatilinea apprima TaxID=1134406 RepID=A0A0P6XU60_9CHLR|nr:ferrous iron transport protein B [Ornatilinea apprima]KPL78665.1 iron transporter [Ornatilinea apprima]